jgi:hypothetical protein
MSLFTPNHSRASLVVFTLIGSLILAQPSPAGTTPGEPTGTVNTFETGKFSLDEIHVAETGSDTTGNGSLVRPYASIGRAAQDAQPGDAIRVHAGTYVGGTYINGLSGTPDNPIWIGGALGEAKPVINGAGEGLHLSRVRYLVIHNLIVQNASSNGINTDDGGEYSNPEATRHIIFRDLEIYDIGGSGNQDCLKLSGVDDYFVLDSIFARCGGGTSGSGIDHVGCHGGWIQGNYFETMSGNAVQTKGGSENIRIHANAVIAGGQRAFNIGGSTGFEYFRPPLSTTSPNVEARNIQVTANVIIGSVAPLAFVGAVDSLAANNTIINPTNWLMRILQETITSGSYEFLPCGDNEVSNNLFYFDRSDLSQWEYINIGSNTDPGSFSFSNNLWYAHNNPAQSQPNLPVVESNGLVRQDPLMVSVGSGDYHLQSNSPAIGAGLPIFQVPEDFDGIPYNLPPSIGAFEGDPDLPRRQYLPVIPNQ